MPETFDHHVIHPAASASIEMHAPAFPQRLRKLVARKLRTLIRIEHFWYAIAAHCILQGGHTEISCHGFDTRQTSTVRLCQPTIATRYRNPRRIGIYVMSAHPTWFGLVTALPCSRCGYVFCRVRLACLRLLVDLHQAHFAYEPSHVITPNWRPIITQKVAHLPGAEEQQLQKLFMDAFYEHHIVRGLADGLIEGR